MRKSYSLRILLLCGIFFLQSCTIYHSRLVNAEQAAEASRKTKVTTQAKQVLYFSKIEAQTDSVFGYTNSNSSTAKALSRVVRPVPNSNKVIIPLALEEIEKIQLKNRAATILVPTVIILGAGITYLAIELSNWDMDLWSD